jgi:hypothetical protein
MLLGHIPFNGDGHTTMDLTVLQIKEAPTPEARPERRGLVPAARVPIKLNLLLYKLRITSA